MTASCQKTLMKQTINSKLWRNCTVYALLTISGISFAGPTVLVSIKPLHILTAAITQGVSRPILLIDATLSPHQTRLRPSLARKLQTADLVVWVGPELESQLEKALDSLSTSDRQLQLLQHALPIRLRVASPIGYDDKHKADHFDPHIWLDPNNAVAIVNLIANRLQIIDPDNKLLYEQNAAKLVANIEATDLEIRRLLAPFKNVDYLIVHNNLQYFATHYGISIHDSLIADNHMQTGAKSIRAFKEKLNANSKSCLLYDNFTSEKLLQTLLEKTTTKAVALEPLGSNIRTESYSDLLLHLAQSIATCLASAKKH